MIKITSIIKDRLNKKKIFKVKKKKTYAFAKKKRRIKARSNYLRRKRSGIGLKNFERIFITEIMWYDKRKKAKFVSKKHFKKFKILQKIFKFPLFLIFKNNKTKSYNTLNSLKHLSTLSLNKFNYQKKNFQISNLILASHFNLSLLNISNGYVYTSYLWRRVMGFFIKKGKKFFIKKEVILSLTIICRLYKINVFYFYFFFEFWFKLPFHLRWFSIYKKRIQIPILEKKNNNRRSIILVTNWMKEGVKKRKEIRKLHLKLVAELISCIKGTNKSSIVKNYTIFKNSFRVETIANIQYLRMYKWSLV